MDDIRRILVVIKSAENFQKAVHYGIVLAKRHKSKLYVIIAIHNPFGFERWNVPLPFHSVLEEEYRYVKQETEKDLDEMIKAEKADNVHIEVLVYTGQMVNKEISRVLEKNKIDLLIMRAHKKWRLEHFLFGSIKKEIIEKMPCSSIETAKFAFTHRPFTPCSN
jgi:nucleotide-binding universal stress UspA family protein